MFLANCEPQIKIAKNYTKNIKKLQRQVLVIGVDFDLVGTALIWLGARNWPGIISNLHDKESWDIIHQYLQML